MALNATPVTIEKTECNQKWTLNKPAMTDDTISFESVVPSISEFKNYILSTLHNYPCLVVKNFQGVLLGYVYAHRYKERVPLMIGQ